MKRKPILKLVLWILLTGLSIYIAFMGLIINRTVVLDGVYNARLGIDLKGGMHAILTPSEVEGQNESNITNSQIDAAIAIINTRLDGKGIYDRTVQADYGGKRIVVEIPWATGETEFNPQKITKEIGETAELTFALVKQDSESVTGYVMDGDVLVWGKDVDDAYVGFDSQTNEYIIQLKFNSKGKEDFKNATTKAKGSQLGIFIDGEVISAPTVNDVISAGEAVISGEFTMERAKTLANQIKSGSLPFKMEISEGELRTITPILGENALNIAIQAGVVALIIILIFISLYYRLPGFIASIAMVTQIILSLLFMTWLEISLTLPGIAGIILTIGMGIDANVIIAERMKEEIVKGKNVTSIIRDGYKNAISAIVDGNVTTIISAVVLYIFGTGAIKGFSATFLIGLIINFFTALVMTRSMLLSFDKLGWFGLWWYGGKRKNNLVSNDMKEEAAQ